MSKIILNTWKMVLGCVVGVVLISLNSCGEVETAEPAVVKVSPMAAPPGASLTIDGQGLTNEVVKVGEIVVKVKSRSTDSQLVIELPQKLKPGNYDLVVTDTGTQISSKPVTVRVLDMVTIPSGTTLHVRTVGHINSGQNQVGDTFLLSLAQPLMIDGRTIFGEGCEVVGRVVQVADAGKVKGRAELAFTLAQLNSEKHSHALVTDKFYLQAPSTKKRDAATIGGAAGVGAVIGGIIGGKKGAIIGGSAGGAAATGVVLSNAGEEIDIPSGAIFHFVLGQSIEIEMVH